MVSRMTTPFSPIRASDPLPPWNPRWEQLLRQQTPDEEIVHELTALFFSRYRVLPTHPFDYCIILGSRDCGYRATHGLHLWRANPDIHFIVSGGNRARSGAPEHAHLHDILREGGVPAGQIHRERLARDTRENLLYSFPMLPAGAGSGTAIAIVTASFHCLRTSLLLADIDHPAHPSAQLVGVDSPNAGTFNWFRNAKGRQVIFDELLKAYALGG